MKNKIVPGTSVSNQSNIEQFSRENSTRYDTRYSRLGLK